MVTRSKIFTVDGNEYQEVTSRKLGRKVMVYRIDGGKKKLFAYSSKGTNKGSTRTRTLERIKQKMTVSKEVKRKVGKAEVYRSLGADAYIGSTLWEYRVWIHTRKPDIEEGDVLSRLESLKELYPAPNALMNMLQLVGIEINREIDIDEVVPVGTGFDRWFGYVKIEINVPGRSPRIVEKFFVSDRMGIFSESGAFGV